MHRNGQTAAGFLIRAASRDPATGKTTLAGLKASNPAIARLLRDFPKQRIDLPLFEVEVKLAPLAR